MAIPYFHHLTTTQRERLQDQPETGMGYHIIHHGADQFVVVNGKILTPLEAGPSPIMVRHEDIVPAEPLSFDNFTVVRNPKFEAVTPFSSLAHSTESLEIIQPPVLTTLPPFAYTTRPGDEFVRLSAWPDDWQILPGGGLKAGTYTTTPTDLKVVPSGIAAVGRYALPSNVAACYVYRIIPPVGTEVYFGTVAPANSLCGGGVEVYFPNALPVGSAWLLKTISLM